MENNKLCDEKVDVRNIYLCAYEEDNVVKFGYFCSSYFMTGPKTCWKSSPVQILKGFDNDNVICIDIGISYAKPECYNPLSTVVIIDEDNNEKNVFLTKCNLISILGSYDELRTDKGNDGYAIGVATRGEMVKLRDKIVKRINREAREYGATSQCKLYTDILQKGIDYSYSCWVRAYEGPRDYQLTRVRIPKNTEN